MANRDTPIGFRPASGVGAPHQYRRFPVNAASSTAFFIGDVADFDGNAVGPAAADAGVSVIGVAVGFADSNGISIGHPNSSVSTKYLTASVAGFVDVALGMPGAFFIAQGQSGQTPAETAIGATTDHVAGTGDTTTARSRHELNLSDLNTGAQFVIMGKVDQPSNAWGINADLYVCFNESALNSTGTGA